MKNDFKIDKDKAKARLTEFYVKKAGTIPTIYGTILEIYSPDFKNPDDDINDMDINQINPLIGALQGVGVSIDEVWEHLYHATKNNKWNDLRERYEQACLLSQPVIYPSKIVRRSHGSASVEQFYLGILK